MTAERRRRPPTNDAWLTWMAQDRQPGSDAVCNQASDHLLDDILRQFVETLTVPCSALSKVPFPSSAFLSMIASILAQSCIFIVNFQSLHRCSNLSAANRQQSSFDSDE